MILLTSVAQRPCRRGRQRWTRPALMGIDTHWAVLEVSQQFQPLLPGQ